MFATVELIHCRSIVSELLAGIKPDDSELSKQVTGIYIYLFKALTEAQLRRDHEPLGEAIRVLEIERDTWRQICDKIPDALRPTASNPQLPAPEITSADARKMLSDGASTFGDDPRTSGGLVLDA
jgi:flagellar protein FliS